MKVSILTVGTRGDVQPFIALGKELHQSGHDVTICTSVSFQAFVEQAGICFAPIRVDYLELTQSEEGKKMLSGNPLHIIRNMKAVIYPMMKQMLTDMWEACKDAEILIYHPKAFGGYDIAEKLRIPVFIAHPIPIIAPTHLFPSPALPISSNVRALNKASFQLNRLLMLPFLSIINQWRKEMLDLPKRSLFTNDRMLNGRPLPILYGTSPSVIPYDPSWNGNVSMAGFWFYEETEGWQPPAKLLEFIEGGSPPLAISFSSMPLKNPERVQEMISDALRQTNQRGIVITGWSGMNALSSEPHIYTIDSIPHAWLFPRTIGVIHHGGAGTTAACLKAGKPMVICPFTADQPFWAGRMHALGTAPTPLKEKDMSVEAFVDRINELLTNSTLTANATELSKQINKEQGLRKTAAFIEEKVDAYK